MQRRALIGGVWVLAVGAVVALTLREHLLVAERRDVDPSAPERTASDRAEGGSRLGLAVAPIAAGPPRSFRGDRRLTGRSPFVGPRAGTIRWRIKAGGRVTAQAVVDGRGSVYVPAHDGELYAISHVGIVDWKFRVGDRLWASPLVDRAGNLYVGSDADEVVSVTSTGTLRFRLATNGDADTGLTEGPDGTIYFSAGSELWAIGPDGAPRWRFAAREKIYGTPSVDDDGTIYATSQDDRVYAVSPDGRLRWHYASHDDNDTGVLIGDDGHLYFGSDDKRVHSIDRDGNARWAFDAGGFVRAPLAMGPGGTIYAASHGPRPTVYCLEAATGRQIWAFPMAVAESPDEGMLSGPLVDREGHVYFGGPDGFVYALEPSGALRWIVETGSDVDASPVLTEDGVLVIGSTDESIYAIADAS